VVLTSHAKQRSHQRAIPHSVVSAIYAYGSARASKGGISLTLDQAALAFAQDELPRPQLMKLERFLGCYAIIGDREKVLTVARRTRRYRQ
jgi:hypothetical protein